MSTAAPTQQKSSRLAWMDIAKGLGILGVVYYHLFATYIDKDYPKMPWVKSGHFLSDLVGPAGINSATDALRVFGRMLWASAPDIGSDAVGVFILLGGWALAAATFKKAQHSPIPWINWYRQRFERLYPVYWCAHLVLLVTPFTWLEPIDSRFLLSLTGLRFLDIDRTFFYANSAWWYFSMLIQFYAIFPLLFTAYRRLGQWAFLVVTIATGFLLRYLLTVRWQVNGNWILGGNCLSRLPEFALGMTLGIAHLNHADRIEKWILGWRALLLGLAMYYFVWLLNSSLTAYVFADFYTSLACMLLLLGISGLAARIDFLGGWLLKTGQLSFGIYLTHQPIAIWIGIKTRTLPPWGFLLVMPFILTGLSVFGAGVERAVNATLEKWVFKRATLNAPQNPKRMS
jgi:peptidoglycan/LPS O-acetylase OafA/YrhL